MVSGCGSVGRAVASDTRGPMIKSSHQQKKLFQIFTINCWKAENKEKTVCKWPN